MQQGMRFSLFVSLWIIFLACRSSFLLEGACQDDEFQRMEDPMTEMEELEELIKALAFAPHSRVQDGSSSATPDNLPRRLPMPTPPILPIPQPLHRRLPIPTHPILPTPQPWPRRFPMPAPPILPIVSHVLALEPLPLPYFIPALGYLLAYVPGRGPLPFHSFMPAPAHFLARVPWPFHVFMLAPVHILARVPGPELLPLRFFRPEPLLLPVHIPAPPAHLLARMSMQAIRCKFMVDVEAAGKHLQLLALVRDWEVNKSYLDLMARVEHLFEGHPDLLVAFNKILPEVHQSIVPELARE